MEKDINLALSFEHLAEDFYFGRGREQDLEQAKRYFRRAAQYGVDEIKAEALCNLALLTEDLQVKLALYMEAVELDCAHAMNMVGVCIERYGVGEGTALSWYSRAAEAGSPCGKQNVDGWIKRHQAEIEYWDSMERERKEREAAEKIRDRERLAACLEAAKAWAGKPAAILYIPDVPHGVLNELACDTAKELKQSVLLLAEIRRNEDRLKCAGYDFGDVGLARAMNNPYQLEECWGLGRFAISSIRKEDLSAYCAAVEQALEEGRS